MDSLDIGAANFSHYRPNKARPCYTPDSTREEIGDRRRGHAAGRQLAPNVARWALLHRIGDFVERELPDGWRPNVQPLLKARPTPEVRKSISVRASLSRS